MSQVVPPRTIQRDLWETAASPVSELYGNTPQKKKHSPQSIWEIFMNKDIHINEEIYINIELYHTCKVEEKKKKPQNIYGFNATEN